MATSPKPEAVSTLSTVLPAPTGPGETVAAIIPQMLGDFAILRKLGEGAFGQVFLATQVSLGRLVAVKLTTGSHRCHSEGQVLAGLEHDHIVKVYSEFVDPGSGTHGLCLQYVPGMNLGALIRNLSPTARASNRGAIILTILDAHHAEAVSFDPGALRDREALASETFAQAVCRLGARLAEALAFAHRKGILHCDIKPANILLTPYGRPLLADFNVAFDQSRHGGEATIGGTFAYMAPEHAAAMHGLPGGRVDERSDVFSLGVVLHELVTGSRPALAGDVETLLPTPPVCAAQGDDFPLPGKGVGNASCSPESSLDPMPRELAAVIRRCLDPEPNRRYQSAADLARALAAAWHLLATRRTIPTAGRIGRLVTRHPIAALMLSGALPHLLASLANIGYNAAEIHLTAEQQSVFAKLVIVYNLVAYPILLGVAAFYLWDLRRRLLAVGAASGNVDEARRRVRLWPWRLLALGAAGWFPGGLLFPLLIDLFSQPVPAETYLHFVVSFTLSGLIGVVFSYLTTEYVVFRAVVPGLCDPDTYQPGGIWREFFPQTLLYGPFLTLASAVPLTGAVLLVVLATGAMSLSFRLLVAGLIGLGVAGVGIAERLIRRLRSLAAVWELEGAKERVGKG